MPRFPYGLGCLKDPPDARDLRLTRLPPALAARLPAKVDHSKKMSPVSDQGDEGTCVGFAVVDGMKEYQESKEWSRDVQLSVRYVYAEAKKMDGAPEEEGTYIRCALKVLKGKGVPPEDCWPYRPHQQDRPCKKAAELARPYRIEKYVRLRTEAEMKQALFAGGPIVAGVEVYAAAWEAGERTGVIPMPGEGDELAGGHAVCIVGYDDARGRFKFRNSWGKNWGARGYGYLSYAYMKKFMMDAWSARDIVHE